MLLFAGGAAVHAGLHSISFYDGEAKACTKDHLSSQFHPTNGVCSQVDENSSFELSCVGDAYIMKTFADDQCQSEPVVETGVSGDCKHGRKVLCGYEATRSGDMQVYSDSSCTSEVSGVLAPIDAKCHELQDPSGAFQSVASLLTSSGTAVTTFFGASGCAGSPVDYSVGDEEACVPLGYAPGLYARAEEFVEPAWIAPPSKRAATLSPHGIRSQRTCLDTCDISPISLSVDTGLSSTREVKFNATAAGAAHCTTMLETVSGSKCTFPPGQCALAKAVEHPSSPKKFTCVCIEPCGTPRVAPAATVMHVSLTLAGLSRRQANTAAFQRTLTEHVAARLGVGAADVTLEGVSSEGRSLSFALAVATPADFVLATGATSVEDTIRMLLGALTEDDAFVRTLEESSHIALAVRSVDVAAAPEIAIATIAEPEAAPVADAVDTPAAAASEAVDANARATAAQADAQPITASAIDQAEEAPVKPRARRLGSVPAPKPSYSAFPFEVVVPILLGGYGLSALVLLFLQWPLV